MGAKTSGLKPKKMWTITKGGKWWRFNDLSIFTPIFRTKVRAKKYLEESHAVGVKHLAIVAVEVRVRKGK